MRPGGGGGEGKGEENPSKGKQKTRKQEALNRRHTGWGLDHAAAVSQEKGYMRIRGEITPRISSGALGRPHP